MRRPHLLLTTCLCLIGAAPMVALPAVAAPPPGTPTWGASAELKFSEVAMIGRFTDSDDNALEVRPAQGGGLSVTGVARSWTIEGVLQLQGSQPTGPVRLKTGGKISTYEGHLRRTPNGILLNLVNPADPVGPDGRDKVVIWVELQDAYNLAANQLKSLAGSWYGENGEYLVTQDRQLMVVQLRHVIGNGPKTIREFWMTPSQDGQGGLATGAWRDANAYHQGRGASIKRGTADNTLVITWAEGGAVLSETLTRNDPTKTPEQPAPQTPAPQQPAPQTPAPQTPTPSDNGLRFHEVAVIGRYSDTDHSSVEIRPTAEGDVRIAGTVRYGAMDGVLAFAPGDGKLRGRVTVGGTTYDAELERTQIGFNIGMFNRDSPRIVDGQVQYSLAMNFHDLPSTPAEQLKPLAGRWVGKSGDYMIGVDRQVLWIEHQEILDAYRSKPLRQFVFSPSGQDSLPTGGWKDEVTIGLHGPAAVKKAGDTLVLTWTQDGAQTSETLTRKPADPAPEEPVPEPEAPTPEPETPQEPEPTPPAPKPTTPRPTTPSQPAPQPAPPAEDGFEPLGAWSVRVDKVENPRDDRLTHIYVTLRNDSTQRLLQTQGISVLHETSEGVTVESDQSLKAIPGRPELFGVPVPLTLPGKTIRAKFVFDRNGTTTSITVMENGDQSATFEF